MCPVASIASIRTGSSLVGTSRWIAEVGMIT